MTCRGTEAAREASAVSGSSGTCRLAARCADAAEARPCTWQAGRAAGLAHTQTPPSTDTLQCNTAQKHPITTAHLERDVWELWLPQSAQTQLNTAQKHPITTAHLQREVWELRLQLLQQLLGLRAVDAAQLRHRRLVRLLQPVWAVDM